MHAQVQWQEIDGVHYIDSTFSESILRDIQWTGKQFLGCGIRYDLLKVGNHIGDSSVSQYLSYSLDSGKTWIRTRQPVHSTKEFSQQALQSIKIIDTNTAIALGGNHGIKVPNVIRTTDGGKNWYSIVDKLDTVIHHPRVSFFDSKRGVMVGSTEFRFHRTDDGGETWTSYVSNHIIDGDFYFYRNIPAWIDSNTIFNANYDMINPTKAGTFRTFISYDAAKTWKQLGCTVKGYEGDSSINVHFLKVHFPASDRGYAYGKILRHGSWLPTIFTSYNRGASWDISDTLSSGMNNESVYEQCFGKDTLVYVTRVGKVRFTSDGGKTWKFITEQELVAPFGIDANESLGAAYFFSLNNAIATSLISQRYNGDIKNPQIYRLQQIVSDIREEVDETRLESIEEVMSVYLLSATPIPARESLTLRTFTVMEAGVLSLKLYDFYGRKVADYSEELRLSAVQKGWTNVTVPVSDLVNGVYIARISSNKHSHTLPVLIMR